MSKKNQETRAHLVGSGIAAMSAAAFLIRDGQVPGKNITIYEYTDFWGGSLDAAGNAEKGYICRGTRGFDYKAFICLQKLFDSIPTLDDPKKSLNQMIHEFSDGFTIHSKTRLMKNQKPHPVKSYGIQFKDLRKLVKFILTPEKKLSHRPVTDFFSPQFFKTEFWWMFSTLFAFGPWHSAAEVRRYMLAFIQNVPDLHTMSSIRACPLNNEENIVQPMVEYLSAQGVKFEKKTEVADIQFINQADQMTVNKLICKKKADNLMLKSVKQTLF